jgi:hypothetical protein
MGINQVGTGLIGTSVTAIACPFLPPINRTNTKKKIHYSQAPQPSHVLDLDALQKLHSAEILSVMLAAGNIRTPVLINRKYL